MFLQSYQQNIHLFPNWPKDQHALFEDLDACCEFLISSELKGGKISCVKKRESGWRGVPAGEFLRN
jgi:hypothetical protein